MRSWSANSIEPGQTTHMCRLAWLYNGGKGVTVDSRRIKVKIKTSAMIKASNYTKLCIF